MKEVKAFIKPGRVHKVVAALKEAGFESVTLSKGEGTGAFNSKTAFPSLDFRFTDSSIVKLELVCQNEDAHRAVKVISVNAQTADPGDGIIYLSDIEDAYRIKSGKSLKVIKGSI